jgi:S1-C subfamily serine protease
MRRAAALALLVALAGCGGGGGGGQAGEGSGFVLNGDGEIATNAHVVTTAEGAAIKRAQQVYVEFADGNRVEAKIVGQDPNARNLQVKLGERPLGSPARSGG